MAKPVANPDDLTGTEDTAMVIAAALLLGNDTDADGDPLTILAIEPGSSGTAVLNGDGSVTFTPLPDALAGSFSYRASDGTSSSNAAVVHIDLAAVNDAPRVQLPSGITTPGHLTHGLGSINIYDPDATNLTATFHVDHGTLELGPYRTQFNVTVSADHTSTVTISGPQPGIFDIVGKGFLNYISDIGFIGTDHLTVTADDGGQSGSGGPMTTTVTTPIDVTSAHNFFDFNGDGQSEILWRHVGGIVATWNINGGQLQSSVQFEGTPNDWQIQNVGDFNGDGTADMLWRYVDGQVAIWEMKGGKILDTPQFAAVPNDWKIQGVGDFNGDGKSDILWRYVDGQLAIWEMNGGKILDTPQFAAVPNDWKVQGVGDFNGDGKSDILWRYVDGQLAIWEMNGGKILDTPQFAAVANDWKVQGVGDFNGDGTSDILWRYVDGRLAIWDMKGGQILSTDTVSLNPGNDWKVAEVSDYSGDGKADILWRHIGGTVATWEMNDSHVTVSHDFGVISNDWHLV